MEKDTLDLIRSKTIGQYLSDIAIEEILEFSKKNPIHFGVALTHFVLDYKIRTNKINELQLEKKNLIENIDSLKKEIQILKSDKSKVSKNRSVLKKVINLKSSDLPKS